MTDNAFDAADFIKVELETGTIMSPLQTRLALVPTKILQVLGLTPGARDAAVTWGKERGDVLASTVDVEKGPMDVLAQHVQGEFAMMGMGRASIDIFGDALLLKIKGSVPTCQVVSTILEGFAAGYISALSGKGFDALTIEYDAEDTLLFVGNIETTSRVKSLLAKGISPMAALDKLHKEVA